MRAVDIIAKKRFGGKLTTEEIQFFIRGYTAGDIPDYQAAALLMAIAIQGLEPEELHDWTEAMLHSGRVLDLSWIARPKVDKHSTGGVGDKISICLAPAVAACGVAVPMISGRGLGHTGGTLDKLEAIPGFSVQIPAEEFGRIVERVGVCMIGQTEDLAPADRKLYALRDVTATVDSIPLIASSIMSKKLAEGIDGLVLDVKVGRGAFMQTLEEARVLAETLVGIGKSAGKRVTAVLTAMDQVLGHEVGNGNETAEAIQVLQGGGPEDVRSLTIRLGAEMLLLADRAEDLPDAERRLERALDSGQGLEVFRKMVEAQGGDPKVADDLSLLPQPTAHREIRSQEAGYVRSMDSRKLGVAAVLLGAGRQRAEDPVDPAAGLTVHKKVGDPVDAGEVLCTLHHTRAPDLEGAARLARQAFSIGAEPTKDSDLFLDVLRTTR